MSRLLWLFAQHYNVYLMLFMSIVVTINAGCSGNTRQVMVINEEWAYFQGELEETALAGNKGWEKVTLPHTWNIADGSNGKNDYYRGVGWYRKQLTIPVSYTGKRVFIHFGAVGKAADVYVNGDHVGRHEGAYAAFCFDITDNLKFGAENLITVKADNSRAKKLPVIPLSGDFTQWGGICRDVKLLVLNPVHITPLDFASPGVYLTQKDVSSESARIETKTLIRNTTTSPQEITVNIAIYTADGQAVASSSQTQVVGPNIYLPAFSFIQEVTLNRPHLWDGVRNPYLYRAVIDVLADGKESDRLEQPLGLRYYHVDPEKGFYLNGRYLDLHGVNIHEDREGKGRAISDADREEDIKIMLDMGCNWLRLAHYQHAEYIYDLADRYGIVLWTEIPLVNDTLETNAFTQNCRQQLKELIRQNYNHPSVCFWGLYNELRQKPDATSLVTDLHRLAHAEDPVRPSVAANSRDIPAQWVPDVISWNKYYGWYGRESTDYIATFMDDLYKQYSFRCIGISEYGAGASVLHHEQNPPRPKRTDSQWHPEEYQNHIHETYWNIFKTRPNIWCKTIWVGFDFGSDHRGEGDHPGINDKGLVTRDRIIKKDAWYWYRCNWSDTPTVYITSRRFTPRKETVTDIKVYSNCTDVELFINGVSLGKKAGTDCIFLWKDVNLTNNDNAIKAIGYVNGSTRQDTCTWTVES